VKVNVGRIERVKETCNHREESYEVETERKGVESVIKVPEDHIRCWVRTVTLFQCQAGGVEGLELRHSYD